MRRTLIASTCLCLALAFAGFAQAEPFIPGYTDVPNALRVADEQRVAFIPGYTDVPNALRFAPPGTIRRTPVIVTTSPSASGFQWRDAGVGAVATAAMLLAFAGLSISLRRRGRVAAS